MIIEKESNVSNKNLKSPEHNLCTDKKTLKEWWEEREKLINPTSHMQFIWIKWIRQLVLKNKFEKCELWTANVESFALKCED